ncbi:hypothetical protein M8R21_48005 [Klebsiella sp. T2.Ur]|nr:hypothetical protein [Klebsiella sp. T2.Ur]
MLDIKEMTRKLDQNRKM